MRLRIGNVTEIHVVESLIVVRFVVRGIMVAVIRRSQFGVTNIWPIVVVRQSYRLFGLTKMLFTEAEGSESRMSVSLLLVEVKIERRYSWMIVIIVVVVVVVVIKFVIGRRNFSW